MLVIGVKGFTFSCSCNNYTGVIKVMGRAQEKPSQSGTCSSCTFLIALLLCLCTKEMGPLLGRLQLQAELWLREKVLACIFGMRKWSCMKNLDCSTSSPELIHWGILLQMSVAKELQSLGMAERLPYFFPSNAVFIRDGQNQIFLDVPSLVLHLDKKSK